MKFYFHLDAEKEFNEAVKYYEECQQGLGLEFAEEVHATISRIISYPNAWTQLSSNTRRCLTNRFPYGVIYQLKSNRFRIIAVTNLSCRPNYWQERINK